MAPEVCFWGMFSPSSRGKKDKAKTTEIWKNGSTDWKTSKNFKGKSRDRGNCLDPTTHPSLLPIFHSPSYTFPLE